MVTMATGSITVNLPADLVQAIDQAVRSGIAKSRNELILLALGHELKACKHVEDDDSLTMGDFYM
ncbi:MAG: ribbon-helix-helix domain-containing protein [Hormoscilla sp.]